jgi:hypothetical protein
MGLAELADETGKEDTDSIGEETYAEVSYLASYGALGRLDRIICSGKYLFRLFEEDLAGVGEYYLSSVTKEKLDPDLVFEITDLFANGGLRYVQSAGCMTETLPFSHGDEISEMTELHGLFYRYFR